MKKFKKYFEDLKINADGKLAGNILDDGLLNDLSFEEQEEYFKMIRDKWHVDSGRIIGYKDNEYWFPFEAKKDLDDMGITWYHTDKVTNKEHPDYGKTFLVFTWIHRKLR